LTAQWISRSTRRRANTKTGRDGPDLFEDLMGKQRREQPQDSIFADNPFLDGLFEWMDSPEGQKSIEVRDVLWNLLEHAQLDAKQRKLIWPDAERLDLEQSIQRCPDLFEDLMGKQRREQPQDSILADNPFLDGLFEWMDSPEGQKSIEVRDVLWNLLEHAQLDAKQRKLIWPDAERLDLEQSIQRVQKKYPDFPRDEVEEFLLDWIDMGYDPENYSQAQLDELDSLTERWVADHLRMTKASKKQKRTRHS
jgi:hypothetical protein